MKLSVSNVFFQMDVSVREDGRGRIVGYLVQLHGMDRSVASAVHVKTMDPVMW